MSVSVSVESYDWDSKDEEVLDSVTLDKDSKITVCYDGGRLSVYVDGKEYNTMMAGSDFSLEINNKTDNEA